MRTLLALAPLLVAGCIASRPPVELKPHVEPEVVGVTHKVKQGETLWRIARAYKVTVEDLTIANRLADNARLSAGQELFVPGVRALQDVPEADLPPPQLRPERSGTAPLVWPLGGVLYARFGFRGEARHDGIDIAAPAGSTVFAAADADVVFAGEQTGYGHVVMLQHAGGMITLYAHNQAVLVKDGTKVKCGDPIAKVGEAIRTSGPHLHFEVRAGTKPRDPLAMLR